MQFFIIWSQLQRFIPFMKSFPISDTNMQHTIHYCVKRDNITNCIKINTFITYTFTAIERQCVIVSQVMQDTQRMQCKHLHCIRCIDCVKWKMQATQATHISAVLDSNWLPACVLCMKNNWNWFYSYVVLRKDCLLHCLRTYYFACMLLCIQDLACIWMETTL